MITDAPNLNVLWAELIVEELIRNGVDHFVISPGSRSAPLTVAAARNPKAKTTVHYDERGAAFFALGIAKALGKPCALICTSGTAVANYFPAIVEASMSYVPLIVLTADRPPELQNTGANQTINQMQIYGDYVRHFVAMPCPDDRISPEFVLTTTDHAVAAARRSPSGPVHVNCAYREPLAPANDAALRANLLSKIQDWSRSDAPYTTWKQPTIEQDYKAVASVAQRIKNSERALFVVGQRPDANTNSFDDTAVSALALLGLTPVFADIASGARATQSSQGITTSITNYDLLLLSPRFREICTPDVVVHLGGAVISKRLTEHLAHVRPQMYLHVADHPSRLDPAHRVTHRLQASLYSLISTLAPDNTSAPAPWASSICDASIRAHETINLLLNGETTLSEPLITHILCELIPESASCAILAGNSMPVRYLDMYGGMPKRTMVVIANRGASGIDGNVATASGYSKASAKHVVALIGDVAALHDLNSLALLRETGVRVTLIILNNDGGGIFHFLPIAEHKDVFEKYFATPHGLHFEDGARMFGLPYARPTTKDAFVEAFTKARKSGGSSVIEVVTDREENLRLHRKICDAVVQALEDL